MPGFIDLTGQKFGKLTVIKLAGKDSRGRYHWECKCECGMTSSPLSGALRSGNTASCGCVKRSVLGISTTTHGLASSRAYSIFQAMHTRCEWPRHKDFHLYGGRGIKVCERWRKPDGFPNFVADMGMPPAGLTIERKDNNGNYEPGNCIWANADVQSNNKRNNRLITWRNQTRNLSQWSKLLGKDASWLWKRLDRYPLDIAMSPFAEVISK